MKALIIILTFYLCFSFNTFSQKDSLKGIQTETFLHPTDGFTAYTLKKNELVYNQSPFTFPLPSWAWWGITDKITMEIDLLPLIGGLFQKPHLPVPSLNFRFKLYEQKGIIPSIAFETMFQHLWNDVYQSEPPNPIVMRKAGSSSWYNRFNFSWQLSPRFYTHFSVGATYGEKIFYSNNDSLNLKEKFYPSSFTPDFNLSFDYRMKPWISLNGTLSYGTTFVYLDNIPHKQQISYGFRVAPFYKSKYGFLRTLRAEFIGFYIYLPDVDAKTEFLLPIFPYLYWQWTVKSKKNKHKK